MKPTLVYYAAASLDGYIARPDGQVDWLPASARAGQGYATLYAGIDGLLMGRATYDMLRGAGSDWPYADKPCLVLARNPLQQPPDSVQGRHCTPSEALEELAQRGCRRVWLVGGGSLAGNCLAAGLLDELVVNIAPHLLGAGIPLFSTGLERRLRLREQQSFSSGITRLHYQVLAENA
jgi:dihydrofolate reductase